jgi:hypothetical protein
MGSSFHLENRVLAFRGWGKERIRSIYEEMQARTDILNYLAEKYPSYAEVSKTIIAVNTMGIWEVHKRVKEEKVPWV